MAKLLRLSGFIQNELPDGATRAARAEILTALNASVQKRFEHRRLYAKSASGMNELAVHPGTIVRGKEGGDCGHVARLANATERCARDSLPMKLAAEDARGLNAFGLDQARIDGVDSDFARPELLGQRCGNGIDGALGSRINCGGADAARNHRSDVDDAAARGIEVAQRRLSSQEQSEDVHVELNGCADSLGGAGNQCYFSLKTAHGVLLFPSSRSAVWLLNPQPLIR